MGEQLGKIGGCAGGIHVEAIRLERADAGQGIAEATEGHAEEQLEWCFGAEAVPCFFEGGESFVPALEELAREIESRKRSDGQKSYTKSLLDGGAERIGEKLREEADELSRAIASESRERVASEAADVLYHALVGIASRDVSIREVLAELARRRSQSGHQEKASRGQR